MAKVTFNGAEVSLNGRFPQEGNQAPSFTFTRGDLSDVQLADLAGKKVLLNIFPSIDTGVCATSVRTFNKRAAELANTEVLCVSADLPFAAGRFCGAEGIDNVQAVSTFRNPEFLQDYGVGIAAGALKGLTTRAVVALDEQGKVIYAELVEEITQEPNYDAAIAALQ